MESLGGAGWRLFLSERDSDVCVSVEWEGRRWRFPGHTLILAAMSDVLRAMLTIDMNEKNDNVITIRDADPRAVKQLLRYLYTGITDMGEWWEVLALLSLAHQYSVPTLVHMGEMHLLGRLNLHNCAALHEAGRTYNLESLKQATGALLREAAFILCGREDFSRLSPQSIHSLLASEEMNAENEDIILEALRMWAINDCARGCLPLTKNNIHLSMLPFLTHIRWSQVTEKRRITVAGVEPPPRRPFRITNLLQPHLHTLKFVVELGAFVQQRRHYPSSCLRFNVDAHAYLVGFRIVGLFDSHDRSRTPFSGPSNLLLTRDDRRILAQFNLNSLEWTRGSSVAKDSMWRELIAFLPSPLRMDPFAEYTFGMRAKTTAKWPKTRLEGGQLTTCLGPLQLRVKEPSYGITQLFLLPAPAPPNMRLICLDE